MRPVRLELEGFGAFTARTVVDFDGADLFAFTGPTGAGKSTLVDAMVFALYGSVPRYGDRRLVAPAISQGAAEARVRLDFTVDDRTYVAVRIVRRTRTGATTKEARLETADGELLAGNEKELGQAVERLLGLEYDHFCKCVVLPQGRFAEFLHDKPEARQELLVELLDLGVYRQMGKAARLRATESIARAGALDGRLATLAWATPELRAELTARVEQLTALASEIEVEMPVIDELGRRLAAARTEGAAARERSAALERVRVPEGVAALATMVAEAAGAVDEARAAEEKAERATEEAERTVIAQPRRRDLEEILRRHELRQGHREQKVKGARVRDERQAREAESRVTLDRATTASVEAEETLTATQQSHLAHAVADQLAVGQACPVCLRTVEEIPDEEDAGGPGLGPAPARSGPPGGSIGHGWNTRPPSGSCTRSRTRWLRSIVRSASSTSSWPVHPTPRPQVEQLEAVDAAERALGEARTAEQAVRKTLRLAEGRAKELKDREDAARTTFDRGARPAQRRGLGHHDATARAPRRPGRRLGRRSPTWARAGTADQARLAADLDARRGGDHRTARRASAGPGRSLRRL